MATLSHPKGRTVTVPDDVAADYLSHGWTVAGTEPDPKPKRGRQAKPKRDDDADHDRADHAVPGEAANE